MNRRFFLQGLSAIGLGPAIPGKALSGALGAGLSEKLYRQAADWAGLWDHATAPMLKYAFNVDDATAKALFDRLVAEQRIGLPDGTGLARSLISTYKNPYPAASAQEKIARPEKPSKADGQPQDQAMTDHTPRNAMPEDLAALAKIWHEGWHLAHAGHVPSVLTDLRTEADFLRRLKEITDDLITLGDIGAPLGFIALRGAELYQVYVGPEARGTGAARVLMEAAETRLKAAGYDDIFLDVIPQNARAQAFYTKMGFVADEVQDTVVDTSDGPFTLKCLVMRKQI